MTTATTHHELADTQALGVLDKLGDRVRQFICGLHGHDSLLRFEQDRVSLACTSCSYQSPGWEVRRAQLRRH